MSEQVAILKFPEIELCSATLDEFGGEAPRRVYVIEKSENGSYVNYYPEADMHFETDSIEKVKEQIESFLEDDQVILNVGKSILEEI